MKFLQDQIFVTQSEVSVEIGAVSTKVYTCLDFILRTMK